MAALLWPRAWPEGLANEIRRRKCPLRERRTLDSDALIDSGPPRPGSRRSMTVTLWHCSVLVAPTDLRRVSSRKCDSRSAVVEGLPENRDGGAHEAIASPARCTTAI